MSLSEQKEQGEAAASAAVAANAASSSTGKQKAKAVFRSFANPTNLAAPLPAPITPNVHEGLNFRIVLQHHGFTTKSALSSALEDVIVCSIKTAIRDSFHPS